MHHLSLHRDNPYALMHHGRCTTLHNWSALACDLRGVVAIFILDVSDHGTSPAFYGQTGSISALCFIPLLDVNFLFHGCHRLCLCLRVHVHVFLFARVFVFPL